MKLEKLIARLLAKKTKAAMITAVLGLKADQRPTRVRGAEKEFEKELKKRIRDLGSYLAEDRRREAMATALGLVIADAEFTIARIRSAGLFRASRYAYQASLVADIAAAILHIRHVITLHQDRVVYLQSVVALTRLAPNVRQHHDAITKFLRSRKDEVLKTILVMVNNNFYYGWMNDPELDPDRPEHYSAEEFSEAASLVLSMYRGMFELTANTCNLVDEKALKSNDQIYYALFVTAAKINKFRDVEATIDGLPYQAVLSGTSVTVSSIDPDIEKSVRLGYIKSEFQLMLRAQRLAQVSLPASIREFVDQGARTETLKKLLPIVEEPIRRLTLRLAIDRQAFSLFSSNQRFRDEIESLMVLDIDSFDAGEAAPVYKISDRISSDDIFKMQRYFRFLSCMYHKRLEEFTDQTERLLLTFRSTVFVMPRDEIVNQLNLIFQDYEKTKELIDYLTLDETRTFVDLQYTPFIVIGDHAVIAPHIVAASNLVRNIITANKLNRLGTGVVDPMQKAVADALDEAGFKVRVEAMLRINGKEVETDIVAWRNDVLFLFECKNAYLPCNAHEMRNSFEHIEKAGHQLSLRDAAFREPANQRALFKKLGWDVPPTTEVHTGIIIANRVFHGAMLSGHPVRHAKEFINVVLRGFIGRGDEQISFWKGPAFQTADLVSYLQGETLIADVMLSLQPATRKYVFGPRSLEILTYGMLPDVLDARIRASSKTNQGGDAPT